MLKPKAVLRKLLGYAAYMFGANTLTALLNFGVSALGMTTRPKEAFGDYALYMLIYSVANGVFIFGANATIQRYAANDDQHRRRFLKWMYSLFLGLFLVTGVLAYGLYLGLGTHVALAALGLPWVVTYWYGRYLLRSRLDARREARLMVIASLSNTVFQFLLLTFTAERDALIYGDFLALVVSGLAALISVPRGLQVPYREVWRVAVPPGFWREVLRFTWPLWLSGQVFTAKAQLQGIWTGARLGPGPMGSLQSLTTMWQFAAKPIEYLGQAALPGLVSAGADRDKLYRELLRFCLVSLPVVGLCVSGGIPVVFQVIDWAYLSFGGQGQPLAIKYAEVPLLMLIPSLALPFTAIEMVTNQYSVAVGRPKTVFYAQLVNVAVMVVALLPLASAYGLYGVVLTGFLGELGNGLTFVVVLYKEHRDSMKSALRWGIWATVATALGLAVIYSTRDHALGFLAVAPAVLLYAALMALGGLLVKSDGERIIRAVRRRPASAS